MAQQKKFLVTGLFEGQEINEMIMAYTDKQAKTKAGMKNGIVGKRLSLFTKSSSVRAVRRV